MLKGVHHVHYVVADLNEMIAYFEKNFGLKPVAVEDHGDRGRDAVYQAGPTLIELTQPTDPNSGQGKWLKEHGSGVYHVAWTIDNLPQVAKDLTAKGGKLRGENGITQSPRGYRTINIDQQQTQGVWIQLAQGAMTKK